MDDNIHESEDEIENNTPIKPSDWMDGWINKEMDYRHIVKWTDRLTTEVELTVH